VSLLTPSRIVQEELLDEHDAPYDDMAQSLRDLRRINEFAGGVRIYRALLRRFFGGNVPAGTRLLDIGTGTSDLLIAAGNSFRSSGIGLDFKIDHLLFARRFGADTIRRVAGDAFHIPLRDNSVDVVTSSHFFHHFEEEENVRMLREALRVARRGVVINDTRRHWAPLSFVHLLGALRLVGRITRFDAPASVRRGYTTREARDVAAAVGAARAEVVNVFPYRFGILLWKST
jgi:ubiquinone/menaquinone biosynthesis C-methylase UbiE